MEYTETATITTAVQGTERYAGFLDLLGRTFNEQSRQAVMEAFEMARTALDGMVRYDGTPLFDHSVRTDAIPPSPPCCTMWHDWDWPMPTR